MEIAECVSLRISTYFLCMAFALQTNSQSLRHIEVCFWTHQSHLNHIGIRFWYGYDTPTKATLGLRIGSENTQRQAGEP